MRSEDQMNSDPTGIAVLKGATVWILTWLGAHASDIATWLAIVYSTMLIISWLRREFFAARPKVIYRIAPQEVIEGRENEPSDIAHIHHLGEANRREK